MPLLITPSSVKQQQVESVSMAGEPDAMSAKSPDADRLWTLLQVDQQRITALDTVAVAIRGWVVTLDSALVGFAFTKTDPAVIAVAIGATLLFCRLTCGTAVFNYGMRLDRTVSSRRSPVTMGSHRCPHSLGSGWRPYCADTAPWRRSTRPYWCCSFLHW